MIIKRKIFTPRTKSPFFQQVVTFNFPTEIKFPLADRLFIPVLVKDAVLEMNMANAGTEDERSKFNHKKSIITSIKDFKHGE